MNINQKVKPYLYLTGLIEKETTGSSTELAKKIGVSRSTLFNMLDEIRGLGITIEFDEKIKSYRYKSDKRLLVNTPLEVEIS